MLKRIIEEYNSPISLFSGTNSDRARPRQQQTALEHFLELVRTLDRVELLGSGPPPVPWKGKKPTSAMIRMAITPGITKLPLFYQEAYVTPLLRNLPTVIDQAEQELEILAGAIYCHKPPHNVSVRNRRRVTSEAIKFDRSLKGFLAVVSNTYRSFLAKGRRELARFPLVERYPPLAMFRHRCDVHKNEVAPFIRTREAIEKMTGGKVGVVGLPSVYRDHPLLWGAIAHEVGGHEILTADPGLLTELQKGVRTLFDVGPIPSGDLTLSELQGLLWQYWTEEAASDVCGVLNIGPTYGFSLAVYHAALTKRIRNWLHKEDASSRSSSSGQPDSLLRTWSGNQPPKYREYFKGPLDSDVLALLQNRPLDDLDPHPVDILKLHVVIGAVENLVRLSDSARNAYVTKLSRLARVCAGGKTHIDIAGYIQTSPDTWMRIDTGSLPLSAMQASARRVGAYIATVQFQALHGHSLQDLETWDDGDEDVANEIVRKIDEQFRINSEPDIDDMGDDAQLLAGSYLAFHQRPYRYTAINKALLKSLETSFARDEIWGVSPLHFIFQWDSMRAATRRLQVPRFQAKPTNGQVAPNLNYRYRIIG